MGKRPQLLRSVVALSAAALMGLASPGVAGAFTAASPSGVDVSKWQHPGGVSLDWNKVAANGHKFAFIKATDPTEGPSAYFAKDSEGAANAGLIIGSYHKAHPDMDATKQADDYAALLKTRPANAKTLPPVLDLELDKGLNPQQLQTWTKTFLERIEALTGEKPMIYTYRYFWLQKMGNTNEFTNYPLWLAAYEPTAPKEIPGGWGKMTFWQKSSTTRVNGIPTNVDTNLFNGTDEELSALISGNKAAPAKAAVKSSATEPNAVQPAAVDTAPGSADNSQGWSPALPISTELPSLPH